MITSSQVGTKHVLFQWEWTRLKSNVKWQFKCDKTDNFPFAKSSEELNVLDFGLKKNGSGTQSNMIAILFYQSVKQSVTQNDICGSITFSNSNLMRFLKTLFLFCVVFLHSLQPDYGTNRQTPHKIKFQIRFLISTHLILQWFTELYIFQVSPCAYLKQILNYFVVNSISLSLYSNNLD